MTIVSLFGNQNSIGFVLEGHSTECAEDIEGKLVCSAVSSAAYMAANTVSEIVGDKCKAEVRDGYMRFEVINPSEKSQAVLEGFKLHITELSKQYGNRIKIITEV
jgi:uncharacterized protein YsxB (DUF464 family)